MRNLIKPGKLSLESHALDHSATLPRFMYLKNKVYILLITWTLRVATATVRSFVVVASDVHIMSTSRRHSTTRASQLNARISLELNIYASAHWLVYHF